MSLKLWYDRDGFDWTDALPLGNGRLGAMVFGGPRKEQIQLNEDTHWTGRPYSAANRGAAAHLPELRRMLFEGRWAEAERFADAHMMARPRFQCSYQPSGSVYIEGRHQPDPGSYRRELDLETAIATVDYVHHGIRYRREALSSPVDNVIAVRMWTEGGEGFDSDIFYAAELPGLPGIDGAAGEILWQGRNRGEYGVPGGLSLAARIKVEAEGGRVEAHDFGLRLSDVRAFTLWIDYGTSFRRHDDTGGDPLAETRDRIGRAAAKGWDRVRADHVDGHRRLFGRLSAEFGAARDDLPTDQRIARPDKTDDPGLAALYLQFGRYLMVSASRPGSQPANLQGIWNKEIQPPWGSKYTININTEMNYWLADPANLAECAEPLIRMVEDLAETGQEMAREHYGAAGWVAHHNTDLWRACGPIDGADPGLWPMGGIWLTNQLWDHCLYQGCPEALVARLRPVIEGAVRFALDFLAEHPQSGLLVTVPTNSPENIHPGGGNLSAGCAMDDQLLRDLFDALEGAGGDAALCARARTARARLAPDRIGAQGQLQEWHEDWDAGVREPDHRHVSHLYACYPSLQISPRETPELAQAVATSLAMRGDDATGWGIGWRICLWARLAEGERAWEVLNKQLLPDRTYRNLFDAHPPFQIDGNFGGAAGILEMLVSSRPGCAVLLPALPRAMAARGSVSGLRLRGGIEMDLSWAEGRVLRAAFRAGRDCALDVIIDGATRHLQLPAGTEVAVEGAGQGLVTA
ncbi:glycoside hydrolase N-terminal domain-containing protein [Poseidonocella sp. HB161398]|uniref:glycoside hydrolase family 95 protein n=1 Tax=Poseidonocella sp. HB161398 TaxID=2320855 RepID=UPI0014866A62|nr:glycoside hydrolase family 95 protein [Poseidonocella sp. HB161398]